MSDGGKFITRVRIIMDGSSTNDLSDMLAWILHLNMFIREHSLKFLRLCDIVERRRDRVCRDCLVHQVLLVYLSWLRPLRHLYQCEHVLSILFCGKLHDISSLIVCVVPLYITEMEGEVKPTSNCFDVNGLTLLGGILNDNALDDVRIILSGHKNGFSIRVLLWVFL